MVARLRVIDSDPLQFQKEYSVINKILKQAGRTRIGQSQLGMNFLNEQIQKINLVSGRNYVPINKIKPRDQAYTTQQLSRLKAQKMYYKTKQDYYAKVKKATDIGLGFLGEQAKRQLQEAREAVENIKQEKVQYEENPQTKKKVISEASYEEMAQDIKDLPEWQAFNDKAPKNARLDAGAKLAIQKLKYILKFDSTATQQMMINHGWSWLRWTYLEIVAELAVYSKNDIMADFDAIANMMNVETDELYKYMDLKYSKAKSRAWVSKK